MSADNWAICPRCLARAKAEADDRVLVAADAYGKVPADEYARLVAVASVPIDEEKLRTFREDYEFAGAEDGTIRAVYSGHCEECGLNVDFKHERPFYPEPSGV